MLKVCVVPMRTWPLRPRLAGLERGDAVVHLLQRARGEAQEQLAGLGGDHLAADAVEQRLAQFFFQLADLVRQRRLRDVHALRGAREAQVLGQRHEVAQVSQFHGNPSVTSMASIISM